MKPAATPHSQFHVPGSALEPARRLAAAMLFLAFPLAASCQTSISLAESVQIDHATILLSDLLPPGAPESLHQPARAIALGHAPDLGSARTLHREEIAAGINSNPTLARISIPPQITIRRAGFALSLDSIRLAITRYCRQQRLQSVVFDPAQFHWDPEFAALKPDPALEVTAGSLNPSTSSLEFHLRCRDRDVCSSLLVTVPAKVVTQPTTIASSTPPTLRRNQQQVLIKAGEAATLSMQSGGVSISLQVVALQRGVLGQVIRARDPATHRIFEARVAGAQALVPVLE